MKNVLVLSTSLDTAERGLRVAADLSVALGASLSLGCVMERRAAIEATAGLEAVGCLSSVLFQRNPRSPMPEFATHSPADWMEMFESRVEECWQAEDGVSLPRLIGLRSPDLIVTCESSMAKQLVAETSVPVWNIRPQQRQRAWFAARKVRCYAQGSRAKDWAGTFAEGLGAELETVRTRVFGERRADLIVVGRDERAPLLSAWGAQPMVVV